MIKLLVFAILIVVVVVAFPLSLGFFNSGFSNLYGAITTYSNSFFGFFTNIFNTLFSAPILSIFLSIGFVLIVFRIIFSIIGGGKK